MSEELCPSSADTPVPLPFFVRTSNQVLWVGVFEADLSVPANAVLSLSSCVPGTHHWCEAFHHEDWVDYFVASRFRIC